MDATGATCETPSWMTKEYFTDIVANEFGLSQSEFTIDDLIVKPATEAGDNFASKLYRVTVNVSCHDGSSKKLPLIVKALPQGLAEEMVQLMNVFPKEIEMYTAVLPAFEQLYRDKGLKVEFGPRCLKHSNQPTDILVLEDLSVREFKMANRRKGLDQDHVKVFLKKLAQFHAASAVLRERKGSYSEQFNEGMYAERTKVMFEPHMKPHMESTDKVIRKWPNGDFYADMMYDVNMSMLDEMIRISRAKPDGFNVLNHGDAWCNNLLFQYGSDNVIAEIIPIDYQMCVWSSPTIDLHYFMFTSVRGDDRLQQLDNMINFYHANLSESLRLLEFTKPIPTLKELHLDFIEHIMYGLTSCFGVLPICLMEKTEDASIDTMLSSEEAGRSFREKMLSTPEYVKQMTQLLPFFHEYGAFDFRQCGYQTPSGVSSDFLNLPGWLRKEFFGEVVEKKLQLENGQYRIRKIEAEIATKKGDNYGSTMYRAKLDVENKVTSSNAAFDVIVKTRPTGAAADFSNILDPFNKEIQMYTEILPAFEELYREKGRSVTFGPRCFKTCRQVPSDVIVMEDLRALRYRAPKRQEGLDQSQTELILEKLAEFHAASAVFVERKGKFPAAFEHGLYNKDNLPKMEFMFTPGYKTCLEELRATKFAEPYIERLEQLQSVGFRRTFESVFVDPDGFNVLNHGDFWINNTLFQYDFSNTLENASLIDFQVCFYGSPVLDLNYFLYTSVNGDIKLSKLNHFVRFYHEKLVSNLVFLGYSKRLPTLRQLQVDFYDRIVYGASTMFGILALCHLEASDDVCMEAFFADNEQGRRFRKEMYGNARYLAAMEALLPFHAKKGAFTDGAEVCAAARRGV